MRLVVDANILVAELVRKRGRELIVHPEMQLYMAEKAWDEACYELSKRVATMVQKGINTALSDCRIRLRCLSN